MARLRDPYVGTRRSRWLAGAALVAAAAAAASSWRTPAPTAVRRESGQSVLLITIDTLRADAIGASGNLRARTPWIDRLASAGVRFAAARAHNVVTLPSHANILSGRYPFEHGVHDNAGFRFPAHVETLATLLSARGYRTGAFVSAFPLDSRFGLDRGFDVYDDSFVGTAPESAFLIQERPGAETVARARAWLQAPDARPAFCWVHLYEPHFPYPRGYEADVSAADAALAPLLAPLLGETPPGEGAATKGRTLVVLTSDHGESLGDHGETTHGIFAYEPVLRVPLVLHQPRLLRPTVVRAPARHIDILPTVLDALDVPVPDGVPGRSLLSLAAGHAHDPDTTTYFEAVSGQLNRGWAPLHGVIRGTRKFIRLPIVELYDLSGDPDERRNLANVQPDARDALDRLLASIRRTPGAVARAVESRETIERLRSLGYAASTHDTEDTRTRGDGRWTVDDDPKRLIELDAMLQEVVGRYTDGDLAGALERCRALVHRRPSMAVTWLHLAHLERASGNLEAGIAALQKAVALAGDRGAAAALLGAYLGEAGRAAEAVAWLDGPARREDADPQVLVAYGLALAKLGRHGDALVPFDRAVARDPSNARLLVERGTAHLMAGRRSQARRDFEAAIARNPDAARAYTSLGAMALEDGNASEAREHWRKGVMLDPAEHRALLALGLSHWRSGRRDMSRPFLEFFAASAPPTRYARELAVVRGMGIGR